MIYLDNNATTAVLPEVIAAMVECERLALMNPASQHAEGRRARRVLESARETICQLLGARTARGENDRLLFTSGGTEANNLALLGLAGEPPARVIVSSIEHPSVVGAAHELSRRGFCVQRLRTGTDGVVDADHLRQLLATPARLVSVMLGNNETGALQPIAELSGLCRAAGALVHTDAVQVVGKLPVDFSALGADALSLAAHKFHGPRGIGALLIRGGVTLQPSLFGGFQQDGLRPGTESVALPVGMARALQLWQADAGDRAERLKRLRDRFEQLLVEGDVSAVVNGRQAPRLPHTSNISFPGCDRQALLMALDQAGVACSTGSTCASGSSEPSPVLQAMSLPAELIQSALRFSLSALTTEEELETAVGHILTCVRDLRRRIGRREFTVSSRKRAFKPL